MNDVEKGSLEVLDLSKDQPVKTWCVYMIETACGKLYTGITLDVRRRFQEHLQMYQGLKSKGAKFFRGHEPLRVVWVESSASRSEASKRERQVKAMSRDAKLSLSAVFFAQS